MCAPLITIGITCYAEGDWLLDCWESVLAQTDDRWTAVLVMDGTQHERTRQIFTELSHPRLRKFASPENLGPYPTRNKAFELTGTPYHFYLDGDDQLVPDSIGLVLEVLDKHPDAGFVFGDYECFGAHHEIWRVPTELCSEQFIERQPVPGACVYRKALWDKLGGFSAELARGNADYDFFIGALESGAKGYHCGRVFYRYRVGNPRRVSASYGRHYYETHAIIVRRHPTFFDDPTRRLRFIASGYRRAAIANHTAGDAERAAELAWRAARAGRWRDFEMWGLVLRPRLPVLLYRLALTAWHVAKAVARTARTKGRQRCWK